MKKKPSTVRFTREEVLEKPYPHIDWAKIDALTDADIEKAIEDDPDAAPILDQAFWDKAKLVLPNTTRKAQITIKLNPHTLAWFKGQGKGYQSRINAILDAYVNSMENAKKSH